MNYVWVRGEEEACRQLVAWSKRLPTVYTFSTQWRFKAIPLTLRNRESCGLFHVHQARGITLSVWQSSAISHYIGLEEGLYFLTAAVLGLTKWQALRRNPLLREEDLIRDSIDSCLFARRLFIEEYALLLEHPRVCRYCRHFFESLCSRQEIEALDTIIAYAAAQNTPQRYASIPA